jgi:hypothetical protein
MLSSNILTHNGSPTKLYLLVCMAVLLSLLLPSTALAVPPEPGYEGPEKCAECHLAETQAWQNSLHAKAMAPLDQVHDATCQGR